MMGYVSGDSVNWMAVVMWVGGIAMFVWVVIEYAVDGLRIRREKRKQRSNDAATCGSDRAIVALDPELPTPAQVPLVASGPVSSTRDTGRVAKAG